MKYHEVRHQCARFSVFTSPTLTGTSSSTSVLLVNDIYNDNNNVNQQLKPGNRWKFQQFYQILRNSNLFCASFRIILCISKIFTAIISHQTTAIPNSKHHGRKNVAVREFFCDFHTSMCKYNLYTKCTVYIT